MSASIEVRRVRHPLKMRELSVKRLVLASPRLLRVTFTGDLGDFISASFDDHVKLFFPAEGDARSVLPTVTEQGIAFDPSCPRPASRDYTPRRHDRAANELDIEFVLHGEGPAVSWARATKVGDVLGLGGPRGSTLLPEGLDWYLLVGDETALPAIARRLEEASADECIIAMIEIDSADARIDIRTVANASIAWLCREAGDAGLADAVGELILPEGEGFAWAAGEYAGIRQVRQRLIDVHGLDRQRIRAASYWKQGEVASHETLTD
ncbi:siderophore-interacting protein [Dyella japonica]|uniref:NADPH-dependent ferric siderophore reductase n=1 Tax=Dyella japonica TaxID=231455 RepID=A0ABV2JWM2_9GAMM